MSDSQRADELMHSGTRLQQMLKTIRAKTANDVFELALKVKRHRNQNDEKTDSISR